MAQWRFLWMTDLHYELPETNYLDDPKDLADKYNWPLRDDVFTDLGTILDEGGFSQMELSFVAVGGDITTHGKPEGFKKFKETFGRLRGFVKDPKAICIVPGNHDVIWGIDPTADGYFDGKFAHFRQLIQDTGATSCFFPSGGLKDPDIFSQPQLQLKLPPSSGPIYRDDDNRLLVLNINSAIRCGELNKRMLVDLNGYVDTVSGGVPVAITTPLDRENTFSKYLIRDVAQVTQRQIRTLRTQLSKVKAELKTDWQSYLRVALVHHHVVHYVGQEVEHKGYEFMIDSPRLLEFLESFEFDVVLTGHKHHAYERVERFNTADMFIIGGPTVGGYASESRGFRLIEFEKETAKRTVRIKNIDLEFARRNPSEEIAQCSQVVLSSNTPVHSILRHFVEEQGYSYREVASITVINRDGDARRTIECDDLKITKRDSDRMTRHPLSLPPTSGYLAQLRATSGTTGLNIQLSASLASDHTVKECENIALEFYPPLTINRPVSYRYDWLAVNSFALDKLQFDRKYGEEAQNLNDVEYTHFIPKDPIEALTVVVEFPITFRLPSPPRLRIARVDPNTKDSRLWKRDHQMSASLESEHALRYYDSLNAVALRVNAPSTEFSYGIEWDLPEAPDREGVERLDRVVSHFIKDEKASLRILCKMLEAARALLLSNWDGELSATLMVFEMAADGSSRKVGRLRTVAAGRSPSAAKIEGLTAKTLLPYGIGIAGRAFKVNRIRVYATIDENTAFVRSRRELPDPDYYVPLEDGLQHSTLVSIPLHAPLDDASFLKASREMPRDLGPYEGREPYGVVNIGSESDDCPVRLLREGAPQLLQFQHFANVTIEAEVLRK